MNKLKKLFPVAVLLIAVLTVMNGAVAAQVVELNYNFQSGSHDWTAGFADYPPATDTRGIYELEARLRLMPRRAIRKPQLGFYFKASNRSGDVFMFLKRRLTSGDGIVAGRAYRVEYVITFASDAAGGCAGVGGAPGESVYLKAGGSPIEPLAVLQSNGYLRMNVDKGNQSQGGTAASAAGNIANGIACEEASPNFPFALVKRVHQHTTNVTANASGELWLMVGTDSGFEGRTRLYYQSIRVKLIPV